MDRYIDGDGERRSYRSGKQFYNIYRSYGTKRIRVVEEEGPEETKRVYREDEHTRDSEGRQRLADERRRYTAIQSQQREVRII